jgi:hypothetical protein
MTSSVRIAASFLLVTLAACSADETSEEERTASPCEQLRDHLVELRLEGATGTPDELAQHRAAMTRALGDDFVVSCEDSLDATQIACSTSATDLAAVSACATP